MSDNSDRRRCLFPSLLSDSTAAYYNTGMKKVAFDTIGCRLNQYETERMASRLVSCGFRRVAFDEPADLYVINTCTVTGRADASCRRSISRAGRHNGNPRIVLVGCMVTSDGEAAANQYGVDLIISNSEKENIVSLITSKFSDLFVEEQSHYDNVGDDARTGPLLTEFYQHNRAWVKIGDGCNQNCSYCIVPSVRGRLINRPPDEILSEINNLIANGYREVVLTAVHIGQYNHGNLKSLAGLLKFILSVSDISRLRLSSIEPQEVNPELLDTMAEAGSRVCRHLHIPLQSGSDKILKMMKRPYNSEKYLEIAQKARKAVDNIIIGADVIVGFPGETEDDFIQTMSVVKSGLIDYLHVFSYSNRKGTEASSLVNRAHPTIIKERNKILHRISAELYEKALQKQVGSIAMAISEHKANGKNHHWGITDNYLKIAIPSDFGGTKEIIRIQIANSTDKYLTGQVV